MAFWGIEVKPGKPMIHSCEKARGRLRISQATLGIGDATKKSIVQCNVGKRSPVLLCALLPNQTESCHLDLEFEEADDVMFSIIGPRSVYLTGYYIRQSQQSNPHSDTESYGVDIDNTQTEGSSFCSDDDKYEDSFIDDDELQVCSPAPVSSSKVMDETTPENDKLKNRKARGKRLKKKCQVVESDNDANSRESEDEDGYLLSVFKSERAAETTLTDAGEKTAQATVEMGDKSKNDGICSRKSKEKVDLVDINGKPERETKLSLNEERTSIKNELPREMETLEEIIVNNSLALTDDKVHGNQVEANIINQNLPMSNGKDPMQSLDLAKPRKKRKKCSKEEKTCDGEIDKDHSVLREDKEHKVEAFTNQEIGDHCLVPPPESGSGNCKKSKKRRKELQLEGTFSEGTDLKFHNVDKYCKLEQDILHADSTMKDLPAENGDQEQHIDNSVSIKSELLANASQPEKKIKKKKKKKTQGDGDLNMGLPNMADNQENTFIKFEIQTTNEKPIQNRTLSNGLIIEEVANGPPDGKVAAPGKKVKIYYTAMLKENGHIFDSNVGKTAYKFRLGDKGIIDGWNLGIDGMHVGGKRRLIIPPSIGFGKHGVGENVPPNSWLVYDVELVGVRR
ncbi:hypothetical protein Pfo_005797 [Paulownia fortunei]|nr:hypothetical protein Pfo_005797 [Paulownia fortunei]